MSLEVTKQELLKQAIYLNKLYATTRNQEYKDQETRIRKIVVELEALVIGTSSVTTLDGLSDVTISAPSNAQVLTYNSTSGQWENQTPTAGGGGDMSKSTYDVDNTGVVDNAEAISVIGRNSTGSTLYKGTIVYISGSTGNRPNFVKAQANAEATSAGTFGVVKADIANNSDGYVTTIGYLDNLDTRSTATNPFTDVTLADGDTIYLHPTVAGYITNVKPSAPNHIVYIGKVTRTSPTNGTIIYRIQNGYELDEIHDVAISSKANNDLLVYESASNLWKNKTFSAIFGGTPLVSVPTLDQVTTAGNTTTNAISVGNTTINGTYFQNAGTSIPIIVKANNYEVAQYFSIAQYAGFRVIARNTDGVPYIGLNTSNSISSNGVGTQKAFFSYWGDNANYTSLGYGNSTNVIAFNNATGNVVISTGTTFTDAGYKLDVNGTARVQGTALITYNDNAYLPGISIINTNTGTSSLSGISFTVNGVLGGFMSYQPSNYFNSAQASAMLFTSTGNNKVGIVANSSSLGVAQDIYFSTFGSNTTYQMQIKGSTGNVQIGTNTDSGYKLDVNGTARVSGNLTVDTNTLFVDATNDRVGIGSLSVPSVSGKVKLYVEGSDGGVSGRTYFILKNTNSSSAAAFSLVNASGKILGAQINSSGWPGGEAGGFNTEYGLDMLFTTDGHLSSGGSSSIKFYVGGYSVVPTMTLTPGSTGNVLIGTTTNAGYKLDVTGTGRFTSTLTANSFVKSGGTSSQFLKADGSVDSSTYLTSYTETDTLATVTGRGNTTTNSISVGNITSTSSGAYNTINIYNTGTYGGSGLVFYRNGVATSYIGGADWYGGLGLGTIITTESASGPIYFYTNTEKMRITGGGNVLIGTTTDAGFMLDVNGRAVVRDRLNISGTNTNDNPLTVTTSKPGQFGMVYMSNTNNLGDTLMIMHNDVGGGYSYSSYSFLAYGGSSYTYNLFGVSRANRFIIGADGASNLGMYMGTLQAQPLVFGTNNLQRAKLDGSGNFVVGTDYLGAMPTPLVRLSVMNPTAAGYPTLGTASGAFMVAGDQTLYGMLMGINTTTGASWIQSMRTDSATAYNLFIQPVGGNVILGGTSDAGQKLQVNGSTFIRGTDSLSSTKVFEVQNGAGASVMDFRNATYAFFGCGQGGGSNSGFIFRYDNTSYVQFTGYNYGAGSGAYKPILMDTDTVGRGQGIFVNFGVSTNPPPNSDTEFAVRGRTADSTSYISRYRDSGNTDKFAVRADGALFTNTLQGVSGSYIITTSLGAKTFTITNGLITSVV